MVKEKRTKEKTSVYCKAGRNRILDSYLLTQCLKTCLDTAQSLIQTLLQYLYVYMFVHIFLLSRPCRSPSCPECQRHLGTTADKNFRLKSTSHKMHYLAVKPGLAKLMKHFNSQINRSKVNFVKVC